MTPSKIPSSAIWYGSNYILPSFFARSGNKTQAWQTTLFQSLDYSDRVNLLIHYFADTIWKADCINV